MDQQPPRERDDNPFVELTKDNLSNPSIRMNRGKNSAKASTTSEKSESESSSTGLTSNTPQFPDLETDSKVLTVQERKEQLLKSAEKGKEKRNSPGARKDDLKCVTDNLVERLIQKNYNDSMITNPVTVDDNANNGSSTEGQSAESAGDRSSTECKINIPKISREELIIDTKSRILQSSGLCRGDETSQVDKAETVIKLPSEQKMDVDVDSQKRSAKTAVCDESEKKKKKSNDDIQDCSAPCTEGTKKNCLEILEDAMSKYEIQESDDEPMEEKTVMMETQEDKYVEKGGITRYRKELEQKKLRERIAAANAKGIYFEQSGGESGQEEKHNSENILNLLHLKTGPVKIIEARLEEETAATKEMSPKELAEFMEQSRREKKSSILDNTNVEMESENDANANVVESKKSFRERLNQATSEGFFSQGPLKREQEILIRKIEELEKKLEEIFEDAEKRNICIDSQEEEVEDSPKEKVDLTEYMVKLWNRRNKKYRHLRAIVGWELTTEDLEGFMLEPSTDNLNADQSSINSNYDEDVRALLNRIVEQETNSIFPKDTSSADERVETSSDIAEKKRRLQERIADSKAKGLFFESSDSSDDEDDDDDDEDDNDDTPTRKSDQDSDTPPSPPSSQSGVLSSGNEDASSGDNGGESSPKRSQKRSPKKSKDTYQQDSSEVMEAEPIENIEESVNVELAVPILKETEKMEVDQQEDKTSNRINEEMEVAPSDCDKESSGIKIKQQTKDVQTAPKEEDSSMCESEERLQIDLDRADSSHVPKQESEAEVAEASGSQSAEASSSASRQQKTEANQEDSSRPHLLFIQRDVAIQESFFSLEQAKMIRDCITDVDLFQRAALAALRAEQQPVIPNIKFRIPIPPEIEPVLPENLRALYGEKGNPTLPPLTVKAEASSTQSTSPTIKFEYVTPKVKEEPVEAAPSSSTSGKSDGDNSKRTRPFRLLEDAGISVAPDSTVMLAEDDGSMVRQLLNRPPLISYSRTEEEVMLRVMQKYGEQCADYKDLNNPEYKEDLPDQPYTEKVPDLGDEPTDTEILPSKRRGIVYPVENPENPEHHHHHHHDPQPAQQNTVEEPISEQDQQPTPEEESTSEPEPTPAPQPTPEPQNSVPEGHSTTEATLKPKSSNSSQMPIAQGSIVSADMPSLSDPPSPPVAPISGDSTDDSSSDDETSDEDEGEDSNINNAAQLQTTPTPLEAAEAPLVQSPTVDSGESDEHPVNLRGQINPCPDPVTLRQPYPPRRPKPPPFFPIDPPGGDGDAEEVNSPPDSPMPQSNEVTESSMPKEDYPVTIFDDPADNPENQPRLPAEPQRPPSPIEVEQNIPPRAQGQIATTQIVIQQNFFDAPAPTIPERNGSQQQPRKPIEKDSPNTNNTMINVLCHNRRRAMSSKEPGPPKFEPIFHPDTNNEFASDLKGTGVPRRQEMIKPSESLVTESPLADQEQQLDVPMPFEAAEDETTLHAVKMPTHANPPPEIIIEKIPSESGNDNVESLPTNNQPQSNSQEDRATKHQETSSGTNRVVDESIDGVISCVETSGGEEPNEERAESNPSEQGETPQESTAQKSTAQKSTEACPRGNVAGSLQTIRGPETDDEDKSTQKRPRPKSAEPLIVSSQLEKEKQPTEPKKYKTASKSDDDSSSQANTRPGNPHLTRSKDASSVSSSPEYLVPIQNPNIQLEAVAPAAESGGSQEAQGSSTSKRKEAPTPEIPEGGPNKMMAREDDSGRIIPEANEAEPVANQPAVAAEPVVRPARITRRRRAVESESELSDLDRGQSFFSESGISGFDDSPEEDLLSEPSSITPELPVDPLNNTERSDRFNDPSPASSAIMPKESSSSAQSNENTLSAFSDDLVEEPASTTRVTPEAFLNTLPQDAEFLTETFYYRRVPSADQSVDVYEIVPPLAEKRKRTSPTDEAEAKKIKTEEGGEETGEGDQDGNEQSTESKPEEPVSDCDREVEAIMANQVRNDSLREGEAGPSSHTQTRLVTFLVPLDNAQRLQVIVHPPKPRESSFVAYVTPKKTEEAPSKSNPPSASKGKNPSPKKATRRSNVLPAQDSPGSRRESLRSTKQANKESTESKPSQRVASTQVGTLPARGENTKTQQKSFTTRQWSRSKPAASQVSSTSGAPVKKNANEQKKTGGKCKEPVKETQRDDKKDPDSSFGKKSTSMSTRSGKSPKKNNTRR